MSEPTRLVLIDDSEIVLAVISTLPDDELRDRAADANVEGFISKGRDVDHLVAEVRKILG